MSITATLGLRTVAKLMIGTIAGLVAFHQPARAAELAAQDIALLDRLTWGVNASIAAHLREVGTERWLQEQLHPNSRNECLVSSPERVG